MRKVVCEREKESWEVNSMSPGQATNNSRCCRNDNPSHDEIYLAMSASIIVITCLFPLFSRRLVVFCVFRVMEYDSTASPIL